MKLPTLQTHIGQLKYEKGKKNPMENISVFV
jgi:hypothetical protein